MAPQARLHGRGPALGRVAALIGVALLLFWLYLRQAQTIWVTSDGASNALQAWDMLHGNVLLHGWWLSDVSFYTTELPEYALVEAARGLGPAVIWTGAAITYTLLVVLTGLLAAGPKDKPGRERLIRGLLGAGIVLAPSSVLGTSTLISSPDHTGTAVPLLAIFLLIDRLGPVAERGQRLGRLPMLAALPVATGLLLAWVQVADQVGLFAGALPVAVACGLRFTARRQRLDLALAVAAMASVPAAVGALRVIRAVGGFTVAPVTNSSYGLLAPLSQLPLHARLLAESVAIMVGANYFGQPSAALRVIAIVHLAGLAVAVLGLAVAAWQAVRGRLERVSGTLLAAVLIMLAAGLLGTHLGNLLAAREIAVVAPFSAALAGRLLGSAFAGRSRGALRATGLRCVLGAGLAVYLGFLCYDGSLARSGLDGQPVADWLVAHRMGDAVAGYWQADVMTLASGGRVTVAPIQLSDASAYHWEARASWFDPARHDATYAISPPGASATPLTSAARPRALFGPPAAVFHVDGYVIQVWDHNLLSDVRRLWGSTCHVGYLGLAVCGTACKLRQEMSRAMWRDSRTRHQEDSHMIGDLFDSPWKILIVAVVIIVLFGSRKLPVAARSLGKSMRILKTEVQGMHNDDDDEPGAPVQASTVQAPPAQIQAPQPSTQAQIDALQKQLNDLQQTTTANGSVPADAQQAK